MIPPKWFLWRVVEELTVEGNGFVVSAQPPFQVSFGQITRK